MKKVIKVLIFLMIVIPVFVCSETVDYNNAINKANSYILRDNFNKRNSYILFNNTKYIMNDNGELSDDGRFNNGGMLNKKEYDYTLKNGNSWLIIPTKFWLATLNTVNNKYYYLTSNGLQVDETSGKHDVRVTEFVRPGTQVSGEGTINNPWKFEDVNYAIFVTSDINKGYFYNGTEVNNNLGDRKSSTEVLITDGSVTVEINVKKGYVNDTSDGCGLVKVSETSYTNTNKIKYTVNDISSSYNCTVKFIPQTYKITYNLDGGTANNPSNYNIETENFTLNAPTKAYHEFLGWIGSNGNTQEKNVVIEKGNYGDKTYTAKWKVLKHKVTFNANGGSSWTNVNCPSPYILENGTCYSLVEYNTAYNNFPTSAKTNNVFGGWYTAASGGNLVQKSDKPSGDTTLYAHWVSTSSATQNVTSTACNEYVVPITGRYRIELWGGQGGGGYGGRGGYTKGDISLQTGEKLYVCVGGAGSKTPNRGGVQLIAGGFNGGGTTRGPQQAGSLAGCRSWGSGGGATDVRLTGGAWNNETSLRSRIMVAAGGGGSFYAACGNQPENGTYYGGYGGGLTGEDGRDNPGSIRLYGRQYGYRGTGATQTSAGTNSAGFGYAAWWSTGAYYAGGGGGYYGGGNSDHVQSAGGGSSYISGHKGCVAVKSASDSSPKSGCANGTTNIECSYHYSGKRFTNTTMTADSRSGAGTAKITFLGAY